MAARSVITSVTSRDKRRDRCAPRSDECVGGREPGHAETDDEDAQAGPVCIPVRQPAPRLVGGIEGHCGPTTHSA